MTGGVYSKKPATLFSSKKKQTNQQPKPEQISIIFGGTRSKKKNYHDPYDTKNVRSGHGARTAELLGTLARPMPPSTRYTIRQVWMVNS